jgi:hypothetical protein
LKRPWYLTAWLVLIFIAAFLALIGYTLGGAAVRAQFPSLPSFVIPLFALLTLAELAATILIWEWKKMGFYLFVGAAVIATVFNLLYIGPASVVEAGIGVLILYLVMRPVWSNFK